MASPEGLALAVQADRWKVAPASLIGNLDPVVAYALNDALLHRLLAAEAEERRRSKNPSHGDIPPGQVYESVTDIVH